MHITEYITVQVHTQEDIYKAQLFCHEHNIVYTSKYSTNPAQKYKGLIYFRYHDYMPRLPYEFWYYNKDVKLLKISDGLQKRMDQYGKNTFDWDLSNVLN